MLNFFQLYRSIITGGITSPTFDCTPGYAPVPKPPVVIQGHYLLMSYPAVNQLTGTFFKPKPPLLTIPDPDLKDNFEFCTLCLSIMDNSFCSKTHLVLKIQWTNLFWWKQFKGKSRNRRTFSKLENLRFLQNYNDYNCIFGIKLKSLSLSFIWRVMQWN